MIAGPELTADLQCHVAHWDGHDLITIELSPRQQRRFKVVPDRILPGPRYSLSEELPPELYFSLSDVQISMADAFDWTKPMTGSCVAALLKPPELFSAQIMLAAWLFHPDLRPRTTSYWPIWGGSCRIPVPVSEPARERQGWPSNQQHGCVGH